MRLNFNANDVKPEYGNRDARKESAPVHHGDDASRYSAPSSAAPCGQVINLVSAIANWTVSASPSPLPDAGFITGLAIVGGLAGQAYNIQGAGLNQYFMFWASSGTGKGSIMKCGPRILEEASKHTGEIADSRGPSTLASGASLLSWLNSKPRPLAISWLDEFAPDLEDMANPRSPNGQNKQKVLNQLWPLSGFGNYLDPKAFSDTDKNTKTMRSPCFTLAGTGVANRLNELLVSSIATSGLLSRIFNVEYAGEIPPFNERHKENFRNLPTEIVEGVANLAATAFTLSRNGQVHDIAEAPDARQRFADYAEELRHRRNAMPDGPQRELINRNREKALRLAGTLAVGQNIHAPFVSLELAQQAIDYVELHSGRLLAKFESGEAGREAGNETVQERELFNVLADYTRNSWDECSKYHGTELMHRQGVITHAHIQQRLYRRKAFYDDPRKAKRAIEETVKSLLVADTLREIPTLQMTQRFGKTAKAYAVSNPDELLKWATRPLT